MPRSTAGKAAGPTEATPAKRPAGIQQLGDDLLRRVLLLLPQGQRVGVAAVCKSWNQLLRRPDMWTTVTIPRFGRWSSTDFENGGPIELDALHWLTSRCRATRSLRIEDGSRHSEIVIDCKIQTLLLAFAAAPALEDLHIQFEGRMSISGRCLVHVKLLGGLTKLHIRGISPPVTTDHLNSLFSALPALQECELGFDPLRSSRSKAGFPSALCSCTRLMRLEVYDQDEEECLDWRGLSDSITTLQRLACLRLQNVLTAPLTDSVSLLTNLTSLGLYSEAYVGDVLLPLLPAAASTLTWLQQLDIEGRTMSPALAALTGMRDLTLRGVGIELADLTMLATLRHLSRLRFLSCDECFSNRTLLKGLNGCKQLQQLHISDCGLAHLSRCRVLQQLTELRLHGNDIGWPILDVVAVAMPRLVILDISDSDICYSESRIAPAKLIDVLRRCVSLQHLWFEVDGELFKEKADVLMEVQRAVPRVCWHLTGAPSNLFDETQK